MRVAIIGGGWAGLAAAVELAQHKIPITLFESAAQLGGRARRVQVHELDLDNGQHILIGAYHETLRLLRQVGVSPEAACYAPSLRLQVLPDFCLKAGPLPAPLHLSWGLLRSKGLSWQEKLSAVRFLLALRRAHFQVDATLTVSALLDQHQQSPQLRACLWVPLCLAALNTPPTQASAQVFLHVLRDSFFGSRDDSRLILPRVNLGKLFPDAALNFLVARGATVHLSRRIEHITQANGRYSVHHAQGCDEFTHVICATPPFRLPQLLSALPSLQPLAAQMGQWRYQPIYTVYLQYDASVRLPFPMLGFKHGISQWVFDRGLTGQLGLLAVIISAEGPHTSLSHETLAQQVHLELREHLNLQNAPAWTQVIAEKRATFTCHAALQRPGNQTALPHFYLAGDYTASDYPATLEAAVRSGIHCARLMI